MDKQLVETERNLLIAIKKLDECLRQEFQVKFDTLANKFKSLETRVESLTEEKEIEKSKKCEEGDEEQVDVVVQLKLLEENVMKSRLLQKAIEIVTTATELDKKRCYEEALRLYELSIDLFLYVIKFEAESEKAKEAVRTKTILYLERANKIKKYLKDTGYKQLL